MEVIKKIEDKVNMLRLRIINGDVKLNRNLFINKIIPLFWLINLIIG